jgi:hypothetical protein
VIKDNHPQFLSVNDLVHSSAEQTREKEYPLFKTHSKSRIFFFAVHDNEKKNSRILVHLDPELKRVKEMMIEFDFAWLDLQGRGAKGSTLTSHKVDRVINAPKENGDEDGEEPTDHGIDDSPVSADEDVPESKESGKKENSDASKVEKSDQSSSQDKDPKNQATFEF